MTTTAQVVPVPIDDPIATEVLRRYMAEIAGRYYGRPVTEEEIDDAYLENPHDGLHPPDGSFLVAYRNDQPCGCAGFRRSAPGIAEVKRMYVDVHARGLGVGGVLLNAVEAHAAGLGYRVLRLDTRHDLVEARGLYAKHGFTEIPAYNADPYAEHWFEKLLTPGAAAS